MNPQLPFELIYFIGLACGGFFIIWHKRKPWSPKEHLIAGVAGWSLLVGCLLHIFIDRVTMSNISYEQLRHISTGLMAFSVGVFVCLGILTRKSPH